MSQIYQANDKFFCLLQQGYTVGDTTLYVNTVPNNIPTLLVANKGTADECVLIVTGKSGSTLTGVSYLKGAVVNIEIGTILYCLNNEEFINQYKTYLGLTWRGVWNSGTTYTIDDAITYNGSSYAAIAATTNNAPPNATYWQLIMSKGDTGSQGIQGEIGPTGSATAANDITLTEIATPANPSAGYLKVYTKTDNKIYYLDSGGIEKRANLPDDTDITNAKMSNMATKTYKGRTSASTGVPEDVAVATLKTDLGLVKGDVGLGNVDDTSDATKNAAAVILTNKTINASQLVNDSVTNVKLANDTPYVSACIGGETAAGVKSFNTVASIGFTVASTRLTAQIAGRYFITCRQLIQNSTSPIYYSIRVNGNNLSFGYLVASIMIDAGCSLITDLAVGEYIEVHQSNAIAASWSGAHSNFEIIKI